MHAAIPATHKLKDDSYAQTCTHNTTRVCCLSHITQDAHDKLQQALQTLDAPADVLHSDQNSASPPAAAAAAGGGSASSQQQQQGGTDSDTQLHYRPPERGNTVQSVGLVTTGVQGSTPNLWVCSQRYTEFFPGCQVSRKESEPVDKVRRSTYALHTCGEYRLAVKVTTTSPPPPISREQPRPYLGLRPV